MKYASMTTRGCITRFFLGGRFLVGIVLIGKTVTNDSIHLTQNNCYSQCSFIKFMTSRYESIDKCRRKVCYKKMWDETR